MDPRYEEAVRRARQGDPRAYRTIVETLGPGLVRFLTSFLRGDEHAAHDVAQDVLLEAWDNLGSMTDACHLRRWCYCVARCKAVTWIRQHTAPGRAMESIDVVRPDGRRPYEPAVPPASPRPLEDLTSILRDALARLPVNYAGPVHLHYVQGYSTDEIAELLGIRQSAVKMRLHRARKFLRREIHRGQLLNGQPRQPVRRANA